MELEAAVHQPRIDVSGTPRVTANEALDEAVIAALSNHHEVLPAPHGVYPALYACPNVVARDASGMNSGGAFVMSPWAKVVAA